MIDEADLIHWQIAIESELDRTRALSGGRIIQRTPKDPQKFHDFLSGENQLFGSVLDKRIKAFSANGTWGELSGDQIFYLILRLKLAGVVLDAMIRDEARESQYLSRIPKPPATSNASEFWRWLLITTWEALGEDYLVSWGVDLFEKVESGSVKIVRLGRK